MITDVSALTFDTYVKPNDAMINKIVLQRCKSAEIILLIQQITGEHIDIHRACTQTPPLGIAARARLAVS